MMLDEVPLEGRESFREYLAHEFNAPLDREEREQYERDTWGLSREAVHEAARLDEAWGDGTF